MTLEPPSPPAASPPPAGDGWDPALYERFAAERRQPFDDLVALCHRVPGGTVVDLGCGPGTLTLELHRALGAARTIGLDRSPAMVAEARVRAEGVPGVHFVEGDLATVDVAELAGGPVDLVAASASLHWVDGHRRLLAALRSALAPGGQLAFQVPANFAHPSHRLATRLAATEPFASALGDRAPADRGRSVLAPEAYAELLFSFGATAQRVRLEVYGHVLESSAAVLDWVGGTLLTPYRAALPPALFEAFVARYAAELAAELGDRRPYFYAFPRVLAWARFP